MIGMLLLAALQSTDPLAVVVDPIRPDQNVLHYHIGITLPDTGTAIIGATTLTVRVESGTGPLDLDFDRAFAVDSVVSDGVLRDFNLTADGRLRIDRWARPGGTFDVTVYYRGSPPDGLFIQDNVHGSRTAFADNWPNRAHHWFPSEDHPSDKATVSFEITAPAGWKTIANGILEGIDSLPRGRTRWWWRTEHRIPVYTMVIGAGRMSVVQIGRGGGPSHSLWTFAADSAYARNVPFARAQRVLEELTRLIGPFPYGKLAHVQTSTRFGGMENSSAIFYSEGGYARRTMGDGVVAHEMAHQWFGDAVTEYDWHHLWLSEGFASYFAPVAWQVQGDEGRFRRDMESKKNAYLSSDVVARPVIDTTVQNYFELLNANNYPKGAWILHMLRQEIGDQPFFRGIRDYYASFRDSTALTSDLLRVMEDATGRDLRWFFEQWLTQPGYPRIELEAARRGNGLRLTATQVQDEAWGVFEINVPVVIEGGDWTHRGVFRFDGTSRQAQLLMTDVPSSSTASLDTRDLLATWTLKSVR